jgi:hypothetical protein
MEDSKSVAGVDWAGGKWLGVTFEDNSYEGYILEENFREIWEDREFDRIL